MDRQYLVVAVAAVAFIVLCILGIALWSGGSVEGAGAAAAAAATAAAAAAKARMAKASGELNDIAEEAGESNDRIDELAGNHEDEVARVDRDVANTPLGDLVDEENRRDS
jgi:hypothetical protein